ncbi:MAG: dimethylsulfonioproprionate lyase family protein [Pseudomonadota bacterium]
MSRAFFQALATRYEDSGLPAGREVADVLGRIPGGIDGPVHDLAELRTALAQDRDPLADLMAQFAARLPWTLGEGAVAMPAGFQGKYRFCEIVGPHGLIRAETIRFGAYLQFANTHYPFHSHSAEEIYLPVSGTARWWRDGVAGEAAPPGTLIRHGPWERHATATGAEPLVALWAWTGEIGFETHRVDGVSPAGAG